VTYKELVQAVSDEVASHLRRLHALQVHDEKVRGQLEALAKVQRVLDTHLPQMEEEEVAPPAAKPVKVAPRVAKRMARK
jgi:hypothetical protein